MAFLELDLIANRNNMNINILQNPKLIPKNQQFWNISINCYFKLGGLYDPSLHKNLYTPSSLKNEPLSTFMDNKSLNKNITVTSQVIKDFSDSGQPIPMTPKSLKLNNQLQRITHRRTYETLLSSLPSDTVPPDYFWDPDTNSPQRSPKIARIIKSEDENLLKQSFTRTVDNIYAPTGSPLKPYSRNIKSELMETMIAEQKYGQIIPTETKPTGPKTSPLRTAGFQLDELFIPLEELDMSHLYKQITLAKQRAHQHSPIFNSLGNEYIPWQDLPNRKQHPCLPNILKNYRYLTMHNRLFIGRQLAHIPDIEPSKILCPFCPDTTNDLMHLLLTCPNAISLWGRVESIWNELSGTFEDFIDDPLELSTQFKLFGSPTFESLFQKHYSYKILFIVTNLFDILVGNAQYTLIKQHKNFLRTNIPPAREETIPTFEQNMAISCNIIITRMKKIPYEGRWIFAKPKNLPKLTTRNTWKGFLRMLMLLTLNPYREVPICDTNTPMTNDRYMEMILTSQIDSDGDIMDI